jgi:hypothetical protein
MLLISSDFAPRWREYTPALSKGGISCRNRCRNRSFSRAQRVQATTVSVNAAQALRALRHRHVVQLKAHRRAAGLQRPGVGGADHTRGPGLDPQRARGHRRPVL